MEIRAPFDAPMVWLWLDSEHLKKQFVIQFIDWYKNRRKAKWVHGIRVSSASPNAPKIIKNTDNV
jgi:hypothetical protein